MADSYHIEEEYKRTCPYCKEQFTADHLSRVYCPSKLGRKNYCKNRQKRIFDNLRKDGLEVHFTQKPPLKILIEDQREKPNNLDEQIRQLRIQRNIFILDELTLNKEFSSRIPLKKIVDENYDFKVYETSIDKGSGGYEFHLGKYILVKETQDTIKITYKD